MKLRTWCIRSGQILAKPALVFAGFLVFLTFFNAVTVQAENGRGGITIRQENVSIQKVFQSIEKQSGYRFFYNETLLQGAVKVTLDLQNASLQEALDACFRNQPLSYAIVDKTIIVKRRSGQQPVSPGPVAVSFTKPNKGKIIAVRGMVTSNNIPVAGASIMIKGTDNGASTDQDGIFTLAEVDEDAILVVSSVSHEAKEVKVNGQGFITIDLDKRADDLDETVVVAYNTTTRRMNTGAVTVVKGEEIQTLPNRSFDRSLQGLVPGLLITNGNGAPGGGLSNMILRGIGTGTNPVGGSTIRNPLILIDGTPVTQDFLQPSVNSNATPISNPLAQLNPSDIESISVLKDASAIALYGSRASNGVILVTTKRGKAGKTKINFNQQIDLATKLKSKIQMLNQDEYLDLLKESYKNSNAGWTDAQIMSDLYSKFPIIVKNPGDTTFYTAPNWFDELFAPNAMTSSSNLSFSGGNDKSVFYLNFEHTAQDGVIKKTGYDRNSLRFNFSNHATSWLEVGVKSTFSYNKQNFSGNVEMPYEVDGFAYAVSPLLPVRYTDGSLDLLFKYGNPYVDFFSIANPVATMDFNINRIVSYRGLGSAFAEAAFLKHFKLRTTLGTDVMLSNTKQKVDPRLTDVLLSSGTPGVGRVNEGDLTRTSIITTNILRYDNSFKGKHNVSFLVGQEAQELRQKTLSAQATGYSSPAYDQIANGTTTTSFSAQSDESLISYFGQANYNYSNRYFATLSGRRDGSSKFGDKNKYGNFWSLGAGWVISDESFFKGINRVVNYLKIRGSLGYTGNSNTISSTDIFNTLRVQSYAGNGTAVVPFSPGNLNLKWERTFNQDMGVEFRLFNDRINSTLDIYKRVTSDLIYSVVLPGATGWTTMVENLGDIENKGVEVSISGDIIRSNKFQWNLNATWSINRNKLIKANLPLSVTGNLINQEGESFNSFYLKRWAGVNPADGKPLWIDSLGNPNSNYAAAKPEIVGKAQPDGFGGISSSFFYKNFDFSAFFIYQYGFQIYDVNAVTYLNDGRGLPYINQAKQALDRWRKPGDIAANPRKVLNNSDGGNQASTRYLSNGDFIRLNTLQIGYSFPRNITQALKMSALKLLAQANNLATWTRFKGLDPTNVKNNGTTGFAYPQQRTLTVGVNVTF